MGPESIQGTLVGVGVAVLVAIEVAVEVCVSEVLAVEVGVALFWEPGVWVAVGAAGVGLVSGVLEGAGVSMGDSVRVAVGEGITVSVGSDVLVAVGVFVG